MDLQLIKKLINIVKKEGVQDFEWEEEDFRISIRMSEKGNTTGELMQPLPLAPEEHSIEGPIVNEPQKIPDNHRLITAPLVGTFYRAPSPTAAPFVKEGDTVEKAQVLAIIEAMKLLNELPAEFPCIIVKVLAENATAVEFGQPLFEVRPL